MQKSIIQKCSMEISTKSRYYLIHLNRELSKRDPSDYKISDSPITTNTYSNIWIHCSAIEILSNAIFDVLNKIVKVFQQNHRFRLSNNNFKIMLNTYAYIIGIHEFLYIGIDSNICLSGHNLLCYCEKGKQLAIIFIYCILCISTYFHIYLSSIRETYNQYVDTNISTESTHGGNNPCEIILNHLVPQWKCSQSAIKNIVNANKYDKLQCHPSNIASLFRDNMAILCGCLSTILGNNVDAGANRAVMKSSMTNQLHVQEGSSPDSVVDNHMTNSQTIECHRLQTDVTKKLQTDNSMCLNTNLYLIDEILCVNRETSFLLQDMYYAYVMNTDWSASTPNHSPISASTVHYEYYETFCVELVGLKDSYMDRFHRYTAGQEQMQEDEVVADAHLKSSIAGDVSEVRNFSRSTCNSETKEEDSTARTSLYLNHDTHVLDLLKYMDETEVSDEDANGHECLCEMDVSAAKETDVLHFIGSKIKQNHTKSSEKCPHHSFSLPPQHEENHCANFSNIQESYMQYEAFPVRAFILEKNIQKTKTKLDISTTKRSKKRKR